MRPMIILICAAVLTVTIGTIVVGTRSFEGIVVEKPYEAGLAWDTARRNKEILGWTVVVSGAPFRTGTNELFISVFGRNHALLPHAVVDLTISRPSTAKFDKSYKTVRGEDGLHHSAVELPFYGHWDVTVKVKSGNDHASFTNSVYAEKTAP